MPFPFRNPVDTSYDDDDGGGDSTAPPQGVDSKLHAIVQKMIDAGESEENIAEVIKQYKPNTSAPVVPPTQGTGKTNEKVNPDKEWWKGAAKGFTDSMSEDMNGSPLLNWGKGAVGGALNTVGSMITDPVGTIRSMPANLMNLPGQIKDAAMASGTPEGKKNFQEMMGNVGGTPLVLDAAGESGPAIKAASPTIGAGLQSVGDFVAKNQPISGIAPPALMPRTLRLVERGVGKGVSKIGDLLNSDVPDTPPVLAAPKPAPLKPQNPNFAGGNTPVMPRAQPPGFGLNAVSSRMAAPNGPPEPLTLGFGQTDSAGSIIPQEMPSKQTNLPLSGNRGQLDIDLNKPIVNNGSGESSASVEALNRQKSMKASGQQYYVFDRTGQGRPIIGPDAVDYNPQKGETFGIMNKDGGFQKLTDNGGKIPQGTSWVDAQRKSAAIQDNVDKKYGRGNSDKASEGTRYELNSAKQKVPLINRPGTMVTVKEPTPAIIQQAQRLGYQIESKNPDGSIRFRQTGRPMLNPPLTNTTLSNIDLTSPVGGGS